MKRIVEGRLANFDACGSFSRGEPLRHQLARTAQLLLGDDRLAPTTSAARLGSFQPSARALARALFFNRLGELRDRRFENQVFRASGLNLLVAAIILWNSRYLAAAFESLWRDGQPLLSDIMKHVAPLGWEHISLTGDYIWNERSQPTDGQLRPLRRPPSLLAA